MSAPLVRSCVRASSLALTLCLVSISARERRRRPTRRPKLSRRPPTRCFARAWLWPRPVNTHGPSRSSAPATTSIPREVRCSGWPCPRSVRVASPTHSVTMPRCAISPTRPGIDPRVEAAERAMTELEPRVPRLTVLVKGDLPPTVDIKLNGHQLPRGAIGTPLPVNPGTTELTCHGARSRPFRFRAVLGEGERTTVEIELGAPEPASSRGRHRRPTRVPRRATAAGLEGRWAVWCWAPLAWSCSAPAPICG